MNLMLPFMGHLLDLERVMQIIDFFLEVCALSTVMLLLYDFRKGTWLVKIVEPLLKKVFRTTEGIKLWRN